MPYTREQINALSELFTAGAASSAEVIERLRTINAEERGLFCEWGGDLIVDEPFVVDYRTYDWAEHKVVVEKHCYADEEAALADGCWRCDECGVLFYKDISPEVEVDDKRFCDMACAHDAGYECCEHCGEWHESGEMLLACDYWYCDEGCAERDGVYRCERCGEWHSDSYWVRTSSGDMRYCEWCWYNRSRSCEGCGETWDDDQMNCDVYGDRYCPDCGRSSNSQYLHGYGWTPCLNFFGKELFLGAELETDGGSDRGSYCDDLHSIDGFPDRFWMTDDGSLENGVEITSMPMSLAEHVKARSIYEHVSEIAGHYGFKSHDGGRCGLHIHVNRDFFGKSEVVQDAGGYKMMRLLQRFEHQFTVFSRRRDNHWCDYTTSRSYEPKRDDVSILKPEHQKEAGPLQKAGTMKHEQAHSQALNFEHDATFEWRIFRGTLKWSTYFACLAMVEGVARTVKNHGSTWTESVSWYDLVEEVIGNVSEQFPKSCLVNYLDEKGLR